MTTHAYNLTGTNAWLSNSTVQFHFPPGSTWADIPGGWTGYDQAGRAVAIPEADWLTLQFTPGATVTVDAGDAPAGYITDGFVAGIGLWLGMLGVFLLSRFVQTGRWAGGGGD